MVSILNLTNDTDENLGLFNTYVEMDEEFVFILIIMAINVLVFGGENGGE